MQRLVWHQLHVSRREPLSIYLTHNSETLKPIFSTNNADSLLLQIGLHRLLPGPYLLSYIGLCSVSCFRIFTRATLC